MGQTARFQEILRRLAIIGESLAEDQTGPELGLPASRPLDPDSAHRRRADRHGRVSIGAPSTG